ncbi:MAG: gliding motility-associated C-terminal domain-containing protein [Spirochaetaceae bacterium]|jgi:outer membrane protein OmpA-like peptidoglycan-associated protein/flagellar hook assembly protein FlgD|nr:gliding motility-associated C-terminal domain-containing protein [Spirochaetaceae bacterium]
MKNQNLRNTPKGNTPGCTPYAMPAPLATLATLAPLVLVTVFISLGATKAAAQERYYISPNGDGVKDELSIPFSITDSRFIYSWKFVVADSAGREVYTQDAKIDEPAIDPKNVKAILAAFIKPKKSVPIPKNVVWNGKTAAGAQVPDGTYTFYFSAEDDNGNYGESPRYTVIVDTTPPSITLKQPTDAEKNFGQSAKPSLAIGQSGSREDLWHGEIVNEAGKTVWSFDWRDASPPAVVWNGTDNAGVSLPDGIYTYSISAVDLAGNKSPPAGVTNIRYDPTPKEAEAGRAFAEVAPQGKTKSQTFTLKASDAGKIDSWNFKVVPVSTGGTAVSGGAGNVTSEAVFSRPRGSEKFPSSGQLTFDWNGKLSTGGIAMGSFVGKLEITYSSGSTVRAETQPFACGAPPIAAVTTSPERFSPDGDGSNDILNIKLDVQRQIPLASWNFVILDPTGKTFWTANGKSDIPSALTWNGKSSDGKEEVESAMDYPYIFTVQDTQEQTAEVKGIITVDILVRRDGNRLIIRVPAITFVENKAVYDKPGPGLNQAGIEKNIRILDRVAEALQRYPEYRVTVEGHANNVTGTEREEKQDNLGPLSQSRADVVRQYLVDHEVKNRLNAAGIGGTRPVVDRRDSANRWKNRRVEFVLEK